jgi:geranylgeranyl diphosphate synthase type I
MQEGTEMITLQEELQRIAKLVDDYLEQELSRGEPARLWEAAYHLPKAGGKKLRPFLTINICKALGGKEEDALPPAATIELIQAFSLVHDDIIDNDDLRRGVPTVHKKWGIPTAIVAGDLLHIKAYDLVTKAAMKNQKLMSALPGIVGEINKSTIDICEGQELDEELEKMSHPTEDDYFKMISKKTAALFEAATVIGAISAGLDSEMVNAARIFGHELGVAFQIVDDMLGLTANEKELGKPVGSDLREGKRTLLVIQALAEAPLKERRIILKALGNTKATRKQLSAATQAIVSTGALEYASKKVDEHTEKARKALFSLPVSDERKVLDEALTFVVGRRH